MRTGWDSCPRLLLTSGVRLPAGLAELQERPGDQQTEDAETGADGPKAASKTDVSKSAKPDMPDKNKPKPEPKP